MMRRFVPRVAVSHACRLGPALSPALQARFRSAGSGTEPRQLGIVEGESLVRMQLRDWAAERAKEQMEALRQQQENDALVEVFSCTVAATRDKLDRLYRDNFETVQARVSKAHRRRVLIVDLRQVGLRDFDAPPHTFFTDAIAANEVAALGPEDGGADGCTAALSLPIVVAAQLRDELRRVMGPRTVARAVSAVRVAVGAADATVAGHFKGRSVGPIVAQFPALKYLALKPMLDGARSAAPAFRKLLKLPGVRAHCEHLVGYGEGVLRWLAREVPSTAAELGPDFENTLTRDLQTVTGLRRVYSSTCREHLDRLHDSLREVHSIFLDTPVRVFFSPPHMGKSLALRDAARSCSRTRETATCVAYETVDPRETQSIRHAITAFYKRLVIACAVPAAAQHPEALAVTRPVDNLHLNWCEFRQVMRKLGRRIPSVYCVDDFDKILDALHTATTVDRVGKKKKRFTEQDIEAFVRAVLELNPVGGVGGMVFTYNAVKLGAVPFLMFHWCKRPVDYRYLDPPALAAVDYEALRVRISPHRAAVWNESPLLFLACQSAPGLLGHLLHGVAHASAATMNGQLLPGDFCAMLRNQRGSQEAEESLRHLVCSELIEFGGHPENTTKAQQTGLAVAVSRTQTVVHPLALVVVLGVPEGEAALDTPLCSKLKRTARSLLSLAVQKVAPDPKTRQLTVLRHGLEGLHHAARAIHTVEANLLKTWDLNGGGSSATGAMEKELRRTKRTFLATATFTARALLAMEIARGKGTHADIDDACTLHAPAAAAPGLVAKERALQCGARLRELEQRGISHFAWHLVAGSTREQQGIADVLEGVLEPAGWALTLTGCVGDGEQLESAIAEFKNSLAKVPAPFGPDARIQSIRLVFLLSGQFVARVRPTTLVANGRRVQVELMAAPSEVRSHISTPLAAMIPSA